MIACVRIVRMVWHSTIYMFNVWFLLCAAVGLSCCLKFNQLSFAHDVRLVATAAQCHHSGTDSSTKTTNKRKKKKANVQPSMTNVQEKEIISLCWARKRDIARQSGNKNRHWKWMQKRNMKYASEERDRFTKTMHKNNDHNKTNKYSVESSKFIIIAKENTTKTYHFKSLALFCTVITVIVSAACHSCCRFNFFHALLNVRKFISVM